MPSAQGTVGRAAERRAPVIVNDYQREPGMVASTLRAGVRAAIAVPLLYEGRLLGALGVVTYNAEKRFLVADAEVLELLAAVAAGVPGLERARLEGALLSARTSAHELGNTLAGLIGQAQLLRRDQRLPEDMVARADVIVQKAYEAAAKVVRLQNLKELRETRWGTAGTTIDLSPLGDGSTREQRHRASQSASWWLTTTTRSARPSPKRWSSRATASRARLMACRPSKRSRQRCPTPSCST